MSSPINAAGQTSVPRDIVTPAARPSHVLRNAVAQSAQNLMQLHHPQQGDRIPADLRQATVSTRPLLGITPASWRQRMRTGGMAGALEVMSRLSSTHRQYDSRETEKILDGLCANLQKNSDALDWTAIAEMYRHLKPLSTLYKGAMPYNGTKPARKLLLNRMETLAPGDVLKPDLKSIAAILDTQSHPDMSIQTVQFLLGLLEKHAPGPSQPPQEGMQPTFDDIGKICNCAAFVLNRNLAERMMLCMTNYANALPPGEQCSEDAFKNLFGNLDHLSDYSPAIDFYSTVAPRIPNTLTVNLSFFAAASRSLIRLPESAGTRVLQRMRPRIETGKPDLQLTGGELSDIARVLERLPDEVRNELAPKILHYIGLLLDAMEKELQQPIVRPPMDARLALLNDLKLALAAFPDEQTYMFHASLDKCMNGYGPQPKKTGFKRQLAFPLANGDAGLANSAAKQNLFYLGDCGEKWLDAVIKNGKGALMDSMKFVRRCAMPSFLHAFHQAVPLHLRGHIDHAIARSYFSDLQRDLFHNFCVRIHNLSSLEGDAAKAEFDEIGKFTAFWQQHANVKSHDLLCTIRKAADLSSLHKEFADWLVGWDTHPGGILIKDIAGPKDRNGNSGHSAPTWKVLWRVYEHAVQALSPLDLTGHKKAMLCVLIDYGAFQHLQSLNSLIPNVFIQLDKSPHHTTKMRIGTGGYGLLKAKWESGTNALDAIRQETDIDNLRTMAAKFFSEFGQCCLDAKEKILASKGDINFEDLLLENPELLDQSLALISDMIENGRQNIMAPHLAPDVRNPGERIANELWKFISEFVYDLPPAAEGSNKALRKYMHEKMSEVYEYASRIKHTGPNRLKPQINMQTRCLEATLIEPLRQLMTTYEMLYAVQGDLLRRCEVSEEHIVQFTMRHVAEEQYGNLLERLLIADPTLPYDFTTGRQPNTEQSVESASTSMQAMTIKSPGSTVSNAQESANLAFDKMLADGAVSYMKIDNDPSARESDLRNVQDRIMPALVQDAVRHFLDDPGADTLSMTIRHAGNGEALKSLDTLQQPVIDVTKTRETGVFQLNVRKAGHDARMDKPVNWTIRRVCQPNFRIDSEQVRFNDAYHQNVILDLWNAACEAIKRREGEKDRVFRRHDRNDPMFLSLRDTQKFKLGNGEFFVGYTGTDGLIQDLTVRRILTGDQSEFVFELIDFHRTLMPCLGRDVTHLRTGRKFSIPSKFVTINTHYMEDTQTIWDSACTALQESTPRSAGQDAWLSTFAIDGKTYAVSIQLDDWNTVTSLRVSTNKADIDRNKFVLLLSDKPSAFDAPR